MGNKCDLEENRAVSYEEGLELANHYSVRFLECSARQSKNIDQAFQLMTREIKNNVAHAQPRRNTVENKAGPTKLSSSKSLTPQKKGCC